VLLNKEGDRTFCHSPLQLLF